MDENPVFCPACGRENPAGATACRNCGVVLSARINPSHKSETIPWYSTGWSRSGPETKARLLKALFIWATIPTIGIVLLILYVNSVASRYSLGIGGSGGVMTVANLGVIQTAEEMYDKKNGRYANFKELYSSGMLPLQGYKLVSECEMSTKYASYVISLEGQGRAFLIKVTDIKSGKKMIVTESSRNMLDKVAAQQGWKK